MLGAAIIVLRETLEAALLVGIIGAATRSIAGRGRWIAGGVLAGLAGAGLVAAMTGQISALFDGLGQDIFNAAVLGVAVLMLGWHQVWMSAHGKALAEGARKVGHELREGRRELSAILLVIGLAVLREGSETVLFLYGLLSGGDTTVLSVASGCALGLIGGGVLGYALYAGMVRIPLRWFFSVMSVLVLLLAAGMASKMTRFLIQADLLPSLRSPLWDMSSVVSLDSPAGAFMHALLGYEPAPEGMQVVVYVLVTLAILVGMQLAGRSASGPKPQ